MTLLDRTIAAISPRWAFHRRQYRNLMNSYDAAKPSRLRKERSDTSSGNALAERSAAALRAHARYLHRNHDIARGALNTLVNNVVGPNGIGIEPQPRDTNGDIIESLSSQLLELYRDWSIHPEVTGTLSWAKTQRMAAMSWIRDGEVLAQMLPGKIPALNHGTRVPFSLELLEADYLPIDYSDDSRGITQGVERNAWGKPRNYWLYKNHPGDNHLMPMRQDLKPVPAVRMLRPVLIDRIGQVRGVSQFASVITRLDDVKDYEESERIAAKVAASMAAVIKKGMPEIYEGQTDTDGNTIHREMKFRPGMIFDDLMPGESIETIDTNRPNPNVENFRGGQLRAAAGGFGISYSSMAKDYNGTYSAQRQELVEQWINNAVISADFITAFVQPSWRMFVASALAADLLDLPAELDMTTLDDAMYVTPAMPWIDPKKEAESFETLERAGYVSGPEIIRKRGGNPSETLKQEAAWRKKAADEGLVLSTDPANDQPEPTSETETDEKEGEDNA